VTSEFFSDVSSGYIMVAILSAVVTSTLICHGGHFIDVMSDDVTSDDGTDG